MLPGDLTGHAREGSVAALARSSAYPSILASGTAVGGLLTCNTPLGGRAYSKLPRPMGDMTSINHRPATISKSRVPSSQGKFASGEFFLGLRCNRRCKSVQIGGAGDIN